MPGREREIAEVSELLKIHPIVWIWGDGGNGKTTFAEEFMQVYPEPTQMVVFPIPNNDKTAEDFEDSHYSNSIDETTKLIINDEFECPESPDQTIDAVREHIKGGRRFILIVHTPRISFTRSSHLPRLDRHIIQLITDYPETPWIHIKKWHLQT